MAGRLTNAQGKFLRALCYHKGTIEEIAKECGTPMHTVEKWLGDPTFRHHLRKRVKGMIRMRELDLTRGAMEGAARQLMLMQASDWPFVVHSQGAVDYGIQRFSGHATGFNRATAIAEHLAGGRAMTAVQRVEMEDMDLHDRVFKEIDLGWWS